MTYTTVDLAGKVALVTGASRGIGRATAIKLAKEGANVVINYVSSAGAADEVVNEIGTDRAIALQADVTKSSEIRSLIKQTVDRFQRIDILVLNAGLLLQNGGLDVVDEEIFDQLFAANVKAPLLMTQEAVQHIPDGGRVLLFFLSLVFFAVWMFARRWWFRCQRCGVDRIDFSWLCMDVVKGG